MEENILHTSLHPFNLEFSINQHTLTSQGNYIRYASISWNAAYCALKSLFGFQHVTSQWKYANKIILRWLPGLWICRWRQEVWLEYSRHRQHVLWVALAAVGGAEWPGPPQRPAHLSHQCGNRGGKCCGQASGHSCEPCRHWEHPQDRQRGEKEVHADLHCSFCSSVMVDLPFYFFGWLPKYQVHQLSTGRPVSLKTYRPMIWGWGGLGTYWHTFTFDGKLWISVSSIWAV